MVGCRIEEGDYEEEKEMEEIEKRGRVRGRKDRAKSKEQKNTLRLSIHHLIVDLSCIFSLSCF